CHIPRPRGLMSRPISSLECGADCLSLSEALLEHCPSRRVRKQRTCAHTSGSGLPLRLGIAKPPQFRGSMDHAALARPVLDFAGPGPRGLRPWAPPAEATLAAQCAFAPTALGRRRAESSLFPSTRGGLFFARIVDRWRLGRR